MSLKVLSLLFLFFVSKSVNANEWERRFEHIVRRLDQQEKRIDYLESILSKGSNDKLEQANGEKHETMDSLSTNNISRRYSKEERGISFNNICSFFVSLSHDLHLHKDAPVIFNDVLLNENNCYNNGDGVFVSSLDGIYIFHWKITTHTGGKAGVHIIRNGRVAGMSLYVKSYHSATTVSGEVNHNSASGFAILRLQRGDHVNLVVSSENSFIHAGHSGFGGFYLRN